MSSHVDSVEADILGWNSVCRCAVVVRLRQNVLSSLVSTKQNTLALLKPSQAHFAPLEVKSVKTKCVCGPAFLLAIGSLGLGAVQRVSDASSCVFERSHGMLPSDYLT